MALRSTDSRWLENCMISRSFEPSRERAAKVLVQKLLGAVEAGNRVLKNRVWHHLVCKSRPMCPTKGEGQTG